MDVAGEQIAHVHIHSRESGKIEGRRHLVVAIDPLLAQDGNLGPGA